MSATNAVEVVTDTLTECAETLGDIVPAVYERFFELSHTASELMGHSDEYMRGRMLEQVLELLMSDELLGPDGYLAWELENHLTAYSATPAMYEAFFEALVGVVREGTGSKWTDQEAAAWEDRINLIMTQVHQQAVDT